MLALSVSACNLRSDPDHYLLDTPCRKCDICWYRCPSLGDCLCRSFTASRRDISTSQAAKDVDASQDMLVDIFERIESFFKRLESYTELKPSEAMTNMMAKIMVEVLSIMAIVTVEIKQRRRSQFITGILGS